MHPLKDFFTFFAGSNSSDFSGQDLSDNPFPPCPDSPNCIRYSQTLETPVDSGFEAAHAALLKMKPKQLMLKKDARYIEAVFKIFLFRDDLLIRLIPSPDGKRARLHLRSASRTGYSDLGVNRQRVHTFLEHLHQNLSA